MNLHKTNAACVYQAAFVLCMNLDLGKGAEFPPEYTKNRMGVVLTRFCGIGYFLRMRS